MDLFKQTIPDTKYTGEWKQDKVVYWLFKLLELLTPGMKNLESPRLDDKYYGLLMCLAQCIAFWITVKHFETIKYKQKVILAIVEIFSFLCKSRNSIRI